LNQFTRAGSKVVAPSAICTNGGVFLQFGQGLNGKGFISKKKEYNQAYFIIIVAILGDT